LVITAAFDDGPVCFFGREGRWRWFFASVAGPLRIAWVALVFLYKRFPAFDR
jgi:hypothetical protein